MKGNSSGWRMRVVAMALLMVAVPAAANVDGSFDPAFDPGPGDTTYSFGRPGGGLWDFRWDRGGAAPYTDRDEAAALAIQPDGRILVAGRVGNAYGGGSQYACALLRVREDGSADASFGPAHDGTVLENFNGGQVDCSPAFVAVLGDGRILWGGTVAGGGVEYAWMQRLTASGFADVSFGGSNNSFFLGNADTALSALAVGGDGTLYGAGHMIVQNASDLDFYLLALGPDGDFLYSRSAAFDAGGQLHDWASAIVLQAIPGTSCGQGCQIAAHEEIYLVGTVTHANYVDLSNRDCGVFALRRSLFDAEFSADPNFGPDGNGRLDMDFPAGGTSEGDNFCYAAVTRPGSGYQQVGYGIVVGGENRFISTLGGGNPGLASTYALAEVTGSGDVTRQDAFAYYQSLPVPNTYNKIHAMARQPDGKIVVAGWAGTPDAGHAPSDTGVIRFNADFSRDAGFGNDGLGLAILSLDFPDIVVAAEWGSAIALDNRGRIAIAGNLNGQIVAENRPVIDWTIARLLTSDVIFRDGVDGNVPP